MTLTDSEAEYINIAKKRTALQIQTLNRISGLPDLEPTSPISADNKIKFSSRQACPERTLSKVENVRLSRSAGNKVCSGRVMKPNRIQITIFSFHLTLWARVSVQGVESLWSDCRFIPADWGS